MTEGLSPTKGSAQGIKRGAFYKMHHSWMLSWGQKSKLQKNPKIRGKLSLHLTVWKAYIYPPDVYFYPIC